jgi:hypothetical protein
VGNEKEGKMDDASTDNTGAVDLLSERFFRFLTETFPAFREETAKHLTELNTQMKGVNSRLKKIENGGKMSLMPRGPFGLMKFLPWLIIAVLVGAALTGYFFGRGGTVYGPLQNTPKLETAMEAVIAGEGRDGQ